MDQPGTRIQWGQMLLALSMVVLSWWAATQWTAWELAFQPELGLPWFTVLHRWPVYAPPLFFWWCYEFDAYAPAVFARGAWIAGSGGVLAFVAAVTLSVHRAREAKRAATYGSARWAEDAEIRAAGLLGEDGVVLGKYRRAYLRHDGPEHVLTFAPTRTGKGVGMVIPTLLTWPGSAIVHDIKGENWQLTAGFRATFGGVLLFDPTNPASSAYNPLLEVRRGASEVRDVQNIADILVDPEGSLERRNHWEKTSHALLVGAILHVLYAGDDKTLAGVANFLSDPKRSIEATLSAMMRTNHLGDKGPHPVLGVGFALGYALQPGSHGPAQSPEQEAASHPGAPGLENLPDGYNGVPKLGNPASGALGQEAREAVQRAQGGTAHSTENEEARRARQEAEAAIASRLFVQAAQTGEHDRTAMPSLPASAQTSATATPAQQDGNRTFLEGQPDRMIVSPDRIAPPVSPYVLQAGTVIAGALNTKISSDLPGQITGHVTQNVYDSPTGRYLLIPQGSTLFGAYNSGISFGQQRTQIIWTRLIFRNGESLVLEKLPGGDAIGQSGLSDEVDSHWGQLFRAALVTTLLSVGSEAGTSQSENNLAQAIRSGASNGFSMVGNRLIDRSLNVQPTLTDRPGLPFTVVVAHDIILKPYNYEGHSR